MVVLDKTLDGTEISVSRVVFMYVLYKMNIRTQF